MKRLMTIVFGALLVGLLFGCQVQTPLVPEFRSVENELQYRVGDGDWLTLYDFRSLETAVEGPAGVDGVSVIDVRLNESHELVFSFDDGTVRNIGALSPSQEELVPIEMVSASINELGELILIPTSGEAINAGRVVGATGPRGLTGAPGPRGLTGPVGPTGSQGIQGLSITSAQDEATLFAVSAVDEVDVVVLVGNVVVSGMASQINGDVMTLDFGNKRLDGHLSIITPFSGVIDLVHGTIQGDLTISGMNATFNNHLTVTGTIDIQAVSDQTWNQYGDVEHIVITANGGTYQFISGTIGQDIQILGEDRCKPIVIKGSTLTVPIHVHVGVEIVLEGFAADQVIDIRIPAPRFIGDPDLREKVIVQNKSDCVLIVNDSEAMYQSIINITKDNKAYFKIQQAIDDADEGDTIVICPGTYIEELLILNKSGLTLQGAGMGQTILAPVRLFDDDNAAIVIDNSSHITITGMTMDGYANSALGMVPTYRYGIFYPIDVAKESHFNTFSGLELLNIDRMAILTYPETTQGTTITNSVIRHVTSDESGTSGGRGIWLHGTGTISHNLIEQTRIAITHTSSVTIEGASIHITDNIMRDFKDSSEFEGNHFSTGINSWVKQQEMMIIEGNTIESTLPNRMVGMYLNHFPTTAIIKDNTLTLEGHYVIGIDALNNKNGGYTFENNTISVGSGSTAIALSTLGTSAHPVVLSGNTLIQIHDTSDAELNQYEFNAFFYDYSPREVGILISGDNTTKRIKDTEGLKATYVTFSGVHTIQGFASSIVVYVNSSVTDWVSGLETALIENEFDYIIVGLPD
jgi:hypothetical protein